MIGSLKYAIAQYPSSTNGISSFFAITFKIMANPIAGSIAPATLSPVFSHVGIRLITFSRPSALIAPANPITKPSTRKTQTVRLQQSLNFLNCLLSSAFVAVALTPAIAV